MLNIDSIKNGLVIDHITEGKGIEIFNYLGLKKVDYPVALIINACSGKLKKKDIIKIENKIDLDLEILGLIDSNITINKIENEKIVDKIKLKLPQEVANILKCKNPRCITTTENNITHKFYLGDREEKKYRCVYCDALYEFSSEGDI